MTVRAVEEIHFAIPVTGEFSNGVETTPGTIVFGVIGQTDVVRDCEVRFTDPASETNIEVLADHSCLTIDVIEGEPGERMRLRIRARRESAESPGLFTGSIVGRDDEGSEIFSIPYTGIVAK